MSDARSSSPRSEDRNPARLVRIEPALWAEARAITEARGDTCSRVMRAALVRYVNRYRNEIPPTEGATK